jgi:hypothetical protein
VRLTEDRGEEQGRVEKADTNCTTPPVICGAVFLEVSFEAEGQQRVAVDFSGRSRARKSSPGEVKKCRRGEWLIADG